MLPTGCERFLHRACTARSLEQVGTCSGVEAGRDGASRGRPGKLAALRCYSTGDGLADGWQMSEASTARLCRCERPLRTEETCLRCGRTVPAPVVAEPESPECPRERRTWTRTGVVRAIRAFAF